jgi:hypothetical protein
MKYEKQRVRAFGLVLLLMISGGFLEHGILNAQEAGIIRELSGTVETKAANVSAWARAAQGDRIEKNTIISTGFKSTVVIALGNSTITVRPLTRLSLEEIARNGNDEQVHLSLQTGRVRAEVTPPAGGKTDFTVRSPSATASVRGTSFDFDGMNLHVDGGTVQYSLANGRQVFVNEQKNSYVDEVNRRVVSPFEAAAEALTPALPPGSNAGAVTGDHIPYIGNSAPPSTTGNVKIEIGPGNWGN